MGNKISLPETLSGGNFQISMIGLDNAGKSTILYRLKLDQYITTMPTIGFNCEKIKLTHGNAKGALFSVWDVGGQEKIRPLWRSYVRHTHAILFVIDSNDKDRFEEAKLELTNLIRSSDIPLHAPVIIFANKQDLPCAKTTQEIEKQLGVQEICGNTGRPVVTLPCCAVSGDGLDDCFDLIYDLILKSRKMDKSSKNKQKTKISAVFR